MLPDQQMGPAMQLCASRDRQNSPGGRRRGTTKLDQVVLCQRRSNRKSQTKWELQQYPTYPKLLEKKELKLMRFFRQTESKYFFPKMETSKSTFIIVPCCNGVVSQGAFEACRAICPGTKWPPTNVFFYLETLVSFLLPVTTSQCVISQHVPFYLLVFELGRNRKKTKRSIC